MAVNNIYGKAETCIGMLVTSGTSLCYRKPCISGSKEGFFTIKTQWG